MQEPSSIWPREKIFRALAELRAKAVLDGLDPRLKASVRLVGLCIAPADPGSEFVVVVVPPDAEVDMVAFADFRARLRDAEANDPERGIHGEQQRFARALQRAVCGAMRSVDAQDGRCSFCGSPIPVVDEDRIHLVVLVIRVDAEALAKHAALKRDSFQISEVRSARIATSLINAVILELFDTFAESLRHAEPHGMEPTHLREEEILRRAAQRLMHTPEAAADVLALEQLSKACDRVAVMKYEGREARGRIIIAPEGHPALEVLLAFRPPADISDYRLVRKLLELSSPDGPGLVTNGLVIRGLAEIGPGYDASSEECFTIEFIANGVWELRHAAEHLMVVRYGRAELPQPRIARERVLDALDRLDPTASAEAQDRLWAAVEGALEAGHGALLVVTRDAGQEADRLKPQVQPVEPITFSKGLVKRTTSIDGAILLGIDGCCYAIGAILDGTATGKGVSSRGSRYNSAVRYVESRSGACFAVVVSEDGMVDLIPEYPLSNT